MEVEGGVTRSIIDDLHSWDIEENQKKGKNGVTRSILDDLQSSDSQGDQIEC